MTATPTAAPAFTVIIPVYKVEEYVAECLDSILAQTFTDFELLAVNDGSPDGSPAILRAYAEKDARVRVIDQENSGVAVARNNGIEQARGRYIVHVDADDVIHPQLLEICQYFISTTQADTISFDHLRIAPHAGMPCPTLQADKLPHLCTENPLPLLYQRHRFRISVMAVMTCCKAELAKQHLFLRGIKYDDYPYVCTLIGKVKKHVSLRTPLYGYTVRPGSTMMSAFSSAHIGHHRRALLFIAESYQNAPHALATISRIIYPEILKQIGNIIFRTDCSEAERVDMLQTLRALLLELRERGLFHWRGHRLGRYLAFRRLLKAEGSDIPALLPRLAKVFH